MTLSLSTPKTVQKLQAALHAKAKGSPDYRFYALYDKMYRPDVLRFAYRCCKANGGAAGVDGRTFADVELYGLDRWLDELTQELKKKTYCPQAVRRVHIPKDNGGQRPLGIPTVKDRVVQMATVLVLEPIFEADLQPPQYAYRPGRSAHDAVRHVHKLITSGHDEVLDADLSGYFDEIPHAELLQSVARRISDGATLHLIKLWLEQPVEETDERGRTQRTTRNRDEAKGTPQGAPVSPLLSSVYMRRFVLGWSVLGYEQRLDAHIVNYADDFVICCRRGNADQAMTAMLGMMSRLKLTVNEQKTRICQLTPGVAAVSFDFLGYTFGPCWSPKTGRTYYGTRPSKKRIMRVCREISEMTSGRWNRLDDHEMVARINRCLIGWSNYFCLGPVSKAYRAIDGHVRYRLRRWLRKKHVRKGRATSRFPAEYLYDQLGLVRLPHRTASFPWANA